MNSTRFYAQIRKALGNSNLQSALDLNAERRHAARQKAYTSLPVPLQELRQRAHAIRAYTIDHLDELLAEFTKNAAANGWVIHTADDARQAAKIILEIAQRSARPGKPPLVAKAKTMLGEEIGVNVHLEEAGVRVVETDLGEYIVQLRGEPPAHMTTPAVHLSRADVGKTFQEKLGLPYTDDVQTLTDTARQALRQVFLDATVGLTGANFGIVETGGVCLVTNEGNARMVTTLPAVHVALMGIERLVPTLEDLSTLLYLLPRTATGQKLTVYTSHLRLPRQVNEEDGAAERHLVLVDNGRRAVRRSPLRQSLYCIRCGACLNVCPVFRELGGHAYVGSDGEIAPYPGPIGSVISPGLLGTPEFGHLARASTLCGACKEVCPVDIDLPRLLLRVRAGEVPPSPPVKHQPAAPLPTPNTPSVLALGLRGFAWIASSPTRFALAQRGSAWLARLAAPFLRGKPQPHGAWLDLPAWSGWGASREFPLPALRPFRDRFKQLSHSTPGPAPAQDVQAIQNHKSKISEQELESGSGDTPATEPWHDRAAPRAVFHTPLEKSDLISIFQSELETAGGHFVACQPQDLSSRLVAWLTGRDIHAIAAWEAQHLPVGLLDGLAAAGITASSIPDPGLRLGLTGCAAAIAESGTLVITSGPGKPMSASLLPEIHIAILHARNILQHLPQALALDDVRQASSAALITGPSRTADIEMSLTIGVHGPGELWVFCVDE